jgi:hypothetical protein
MSGPVIFFDTETGGLEPQHPTIQIAAVAVGSGWRELATFERKLQFSRAACSAEALDMNTYARCGQGEWDRVAVEPSVAVRDFGMFIAAHQSVTLKSRRTGRPYAVARVGGHNIAGFDLDRVAALFRKHGMFFAVDFRTALDTRYGAVWHFEREALRHRVGSARIDATGIRTDEACTFCGGAWPCDQGRPKDFKLTGLAEHFGIPTDGAHDALADVRLSIALARRLMS